MPPHPDRIDPGAQHVGDMGGEGGVGVGRDGVEAQREMVAQRELAGVLAW